ncbi:hypothetical protein BSNK01_25640 [Bacillaceae bacterium]
MSEYRRFLQEKKRIDELIAQGYEISGVEENLSGAFVEFVLPDAGEGHPQKRQRLHILTADARKYFSTLLIARQRKEKKIVQ